MDLSNQEFEIHRGVHLFSSLLASSELEGRGFLISLQSFFFFFNKAVQILCLLIS